MKKIYFFIAFLCFALSQTTHAQVVINEVYGGAGTPYNAGSAFIRADFIELYNNGNTDINLSGWSVQAAVTGTAWQVTPLTGVIHAHGYYLIKEYSIGNPCSAPCPVTVAEIPNPDDSGSIDLGYISGKVILCNTTTAQTVADPTGSQIVDKVGYGSTDCFETAAAPAVPHSNLGVDRSPQGKDTDNNSADFSIGGITPTNSVTYTVQITGSNNAKEPATNGSFTVIVSPLAPAGGVTVHYSFDGSATLNVDYTDPNGGTVTIPEGQASATIPINILDDQQYEDNESIFLTLVSATSPFIVSPNFGSINVYSDDLEPILVLNPNNSQSYTHAFNNEYVNGVASLYNLTFGGWGFLETGTAANDSFRAGNGAAAPGDTYSFGSTFDTDRAFGTLRSDSLVSIIGAAFNNYTGGPLTSFRISYRGEEWRLGTAGRKDTLKFQYSLDATSLNTGTWTDVGQLDFTTPNITADTGSIDGNATGNYTNISHIVSGVPIPPNAIFYIRWLDTDAAGNDDGLAIDDFTFEPNPTDDEAPLASNFFPASNAANAATSFVANIVFSENALKGTGSIVIKNQDDNTVAQTIDMNTVTVAADTAYIPVNNLADNRSYYVQIAAGTFTDLALNNFPGISDNSTWTFATNSSLLPVKLSGFYATATGNAVQLSWNATEEINSLAYEVQRAADGNQFTVLANVPAKGQPSTYSLTDESPLNGDNYYRLRMIDNDGKFTYSKIIKINVGKLSQIHISPNPASSNLRVTLPNIQSPVTLQIIDLNGRMVKQWIIGQGITNQVFNVADLQRGAYTIKMTGTAINYYQKLVLQ